MPPTKPYNRAAAAAYAEKWALTRNPRYMNLDGMGGDCTNFISQCIYAGSGVMNYTRDTGWYYNSPTDRAAAWTGVIYLYNFLTRNKSVGPFARTVNEQEVQMGDVIQLGDSRGHFYHSLLVTAAGESGILVSTHTYDAYMRPLYSYTFAQARYLHIEGVRHW